jgi:regulator of sigma E protease
MLVKILAGLVMLSVLVIIHEFGHFVVARLFKVGVPVFSVGMGPRVGGFRWKGTDYRLSALPVGGYVQMAGADPFGEEDPDAYVDPAEDFMLKPVWQRLLVMLAGPVANLALPLLILSVILVGGEERPDSVVGMVLPDSPAEQAGLHPDDRILAVNDTPVDIWLDFSRALRRAEGQDVELLVEREGQQRSVLLPGSVVTLTADGLADLRTVGLSWMNVSTQVGVDDPSSPAARAGLRTGDGIVEVDGQPVDRWRDLMAALDGDVHEVTYRRAPDEDAEGGSDEVEIRTTTLRVDLEWQPRSGDPHGKKFGLVPVMLFVGAYAKDSAAEEAGVQLNDRILAVDGKMVRTWYDLLGMVKETVPPQESAIASPTGCLRARSERPEPRLLALTVVRDGEVIDLEFRPRMTRELVRAMVVYRPLMGIVQYPDAFVDGSLQMKSYSPVAAVPEAARETVQVLGTTFGVLVQFLTRERQMKETIGGPIAIFDMAGKSAQMGFASFGRMMAAISIGLGIINLLPVPVLDGGQILFFAIEGVRGRPLSISLREKIQMIGVLFLVALILIVSVNDITRVISGG